MRLASGMNNPDQTEMTIFKYCGRTSIHVSPYEYELKMKYKYLLDFRAEPYSRGGSLRLL